MLIEDFSLLNTNEKNFRLYESKDVDAIVLISYGVGCPISRLLVGEVNRLEEVYPNILFKYVYSNFDSRKNNTKQIKKEINDYQIKTDVLLDNSMSVAKILRIKRTCETVLVNPRNFSVLYKGMVSERFAYGVQREIGADYLEQAINSFLKNQPIKIQTTESKGCALYFPEVSIDYEKKIVPILKKNCLQCHNDQGAAPFSFDKLNSLKKWSSMAREVILNKRMPPRTTFLSPEKLRLKNSHLEGLNHKDTADLLAFFNTKNLHNLKIEKQDPLKKAHEQIVKKGENWPHGKPDIIISLPTYTSPKSGLTRRRDTWVELAKYLKTDTWIDRVYVKTSNPKIMHHTFIWSQIRDDRFQSRGFDFIKKKEWGRNPLIKKLIEKKEFDWHSALGQVLKGRRVEKPTIPYEVIGYRMAGDYQLDPIKKNEYGYFLPKKGRLYIGTHYKTIGREAEERTRIGLYLRKLKTPPKFLTKFITIQHDNFLVLKGQRKEIVSYHVIEKDYNLHSLSAHGHYRMKSQSVEIKTPAGKNYNITIPIYYYEALYFSDLKEPISVPKGSLVTVKSMIDNSKFNETNPNWNRDIKFGFEQWDEMVWNVLVVSSPNQIL